METATDTKPRKRGNPRSKQIDGRICLTIAKGDIEILKDRAKLQGTKVNALIRNVMKRYIRGDYDIRM